MPTGGIGSVIVALGRRQNRITVGGGDADRTKVFVGIAVDGEIHPVEGKRRDVLRAFALQANILPKEPARHVGG